MGSVSTVQQPNPDEWNWRLRLFFLHALVRVPIYKRMCDGTLAPLWAQATAAHPELTNIHRYADVPAPAEHDDPLNHYITALRRGVADTLRCRINGAPAAWVCQAVHAGITGGSLDAGVASMHWEATGQIIVYVDTRGIGIVGAKINGYAITQPDDFEPRLYHPFEKWKYLRKAAYQQLDTLLDQLRREIESATQDWPRRYGKSVTTDTQTTMPKLVAWLVSGEEQYMGDRTAVYSLLHELGLDVPGKNPRS